jgi:DNA polymerase-4/protein ImuB
MIACVLVPHFSLRVALLARPELDGTPLILAPPTGQRLLVIDCSPEAAARGIRAGMSLREAAALVPDLITIERDPVRESDVAAEMLAGLTDLSPLVEAGAPGRFYVDLRGSDRSLGPPLVAGERLLATVASALRPRVGIAPGKFAAWAAARQTRSGSVQHLAAPEVRPRLATLPASWLPLPAETGLLLDQLGLRTLNAVATLPKSAMAARFGPAGERAWRLAAGQSDTTDATVYPTRQTQIVTARLDLPAPVTSRDALFVAVDQVVRRAFRRPELRDRYVRQARLRAHLEDGSSWERVLAQREPVNARRLARGIALRLESIEIPGVILALSLELTGITNSVARQEMLLAEWRPRRPQPLVEAIRQLKQRYGVSPIYRITEVEPWSRIPERRHALVSFEP